jgi:hypothetical protein
VGKLAKADSLSPAEAVPPRAAEPTPDLFHEVPGARDFN